ncbi:MAG: hypothetical protein L3I99_06625 [Sulfurimonas sp.]|nr:hypothetical protein [Sulfurimonas sp.]
MKKILLIIFILSPFCFALSNVDDDKRIKHALLKYNYGIIKMTKSGDTHLLKDMLSKDVHEKLMIWADSWKFSNLAMVAKINDLRFSPIIYNENNATIGTMENWTFAYADLTTKDYALKPLQIFYQMNYTLQKNGDMWKIIAVKHIKEESFTKEKTHNPTLKPKKEELKEKIPTH